MKKQPAESSPPAGLTSGFLVDRASHLTACVVLATLCLFAYIPSLFLPLIEDDYANIWMAEHYGPLSAAPLMFHDEVARVRATVYWILYLCWKFFGPAAWAYRVSSLILHILNVWLVYGIGLMWPRMRAGAFWAAAFFAIHEGHQEAVIWVSGNSEVLQFVFGGAALFCWLLSRDGEGAVWRIAGVVAFALALLSKESAFILPAFFLVIDPPFRLGGPELRRYALNLVPYGLLAGAAVVAVAVTRSHSFRFNDGSFSLHAPFWLTLPRNFFRVMWIWGVIAAAAIFLLKATKEVRASAWIAMAWIAIGLVPYSFLTYSKEIPSRQLYLASVGLAFLFGLGMETFLSAAKQRNYAWAVPFVITAVIVHNVGYIWIKKQKQFQERAAATEQLIELARTVNGPIWVQCFPQPDSIAEAAMYVALNRIPANLVFNADDAKKAKAAAVMCYKRVH